ncbi:replication protein [Psychrobacter sp. UBA2514]|jgi:phage replication O-like protein O|uniref:replication protein n=1 Tax=Psychrobacter sp. UBA2514 TaxID=1947346 RepID=UPI00257EA6DC|nr:replication protein [Psychrobacter sp. UBA2514]
MKETGYTRVDNKIFDAQPFLSPVAFSVLMRMVRMIDGYGNDEKSLSNTFLQSNCNMSKNTVSKAVKELVEFGFLNQNAQQRKTAIYTLNYENIAAFNAEKHGQNLASQNLASQNMTIRFPKYDPVVSQNLGSNKEKKEKPLKKNIEKSKPKKAAPKSYSPEKPESVSDQIWNDLLILRKDKKTSNTKTAWTTIFNALEKAQQATGHTLDQIIAFWISKDWKGFNADWYLNAQPKPQQTNYQGDNNGNHQSANSQPKSKAEQYRDMLNQQYAERYGQPQPTERTVN